MATFTDEQRAEAIRIYNENGATKAAETTGCSRQTIYTWIRAHLSSDVEKSEEELHELDIYHQHLRLRAQHRILERIDDLFDRMDQPHIDFRGKDANQVTFPTAGSGDIKNYVTSIAILIDKYRLERGEATSRTHAKIEVDDGIDGELRRTVDEWKRQLSN